MSQGEGNRSATGGPRAIAIVGPYASGKTSLLETLLTRTGRIERPGTVDGKSSFGDAGPEARAHGMGVELNVGSTEFLGDQYTFLDCPGSIEFAFEMLPVLDAVDAAIVVAEADPRKLAALQIVMQALESRQIPRILFLNKIDTIERLEEDGRGVREVLRELQPASTAPLVLRQLPVWKDGAISGFTDLALQRTFDYQPQTASRHRPDADTGEREEGARFTMLEALADHDDALMEQLLEDSEPDRDLIFADLVRDMRECRIVPAFIGSALNGNGILRLLKALRHEAPGLETTRMRHDIEATEEPFLKVVKTLHTLHGGKLSLARVMAGTLEDGATVATASAAVRPSGLYDLQGQTATKRSGAEAGELVALGKLDSVVTGEVIGTTPAASTLVPPEPVLIRAVRAGERADEVKLSSALGRLVEEDPSLSVIQRQETGETLLGGQGEMHLRVALERLTGKYGLKVDVLPPHIPYRETIRSAVTQRGRHKKQSGGHGQFGDVILEIAPLARGEGFQFSDTISGGVVPKQYIPAVEAGVREALTTGPLGGFPVVDIAVVLTDGSYHSVDSSDQAFKMAGIAAIRAGLPEADPVLLEPIMKVEIVSPTDATARVNAIVSGRRGQLMSFDGRKDWPGWDVVHAMMPEAEISDLIVELRSATAGVGTYTARFDHFAPAHGKVAADILRQSEQQAA